MQKVKVKGRSVWKIEWKWTTDGWIETMALPPVLTWSVKIELDALQTCWSLLMQVCIVCIISVIIILCVHFYCAMHYSAKRGLAITCRLSVRPSVRLSVCPSDVVGKSWKLIVQSISPTSSLFVAQRSSTYSQGNMEKFWGYSEVGWEKVAYWRIKVAISLKRVKIEEKLLCRAYWKSPMLFRFFGSPPYFYFQFRLFDHRDARFCLTFARTAQPSSWHWMVQIDFLGANHVCIVGFCITRISFQ